MTFSVDRIEIAGRKFSDTRSFLCFEQVRQLAGGVSFRNFISRGWSTPHILHHHDAFDDEQRYAGDRHKGTHIGNELLADDLFADHNDGKAERENKAAIQQWVLPNPGGILFRVARDLSFAL